MNKKKEPILRAENISISFGGLQALNEVSLEIYPGEIMGIIGPNGAGKTTMLNIINGFYKPDKGRVIFEGNELPRKMKPNQIAAKGIARTFQNLAIFSGMSALGNIMMGRTMMMHSNIFSQALYWGFSQKEEIEHRAAAERIIDLARSKGIPIEEDPDLVAVLARGTISSLFVLERHGLSDFFTTHWPILIVAGP